MRKAAILASSYAVSKRRAFCAKRIMRFRAFPVPLPLSLGQGAIIVITARQNGKEKCFWHRTQRKQNT